MIDIPSASEAQRIHTFTMSPDYYLLGTEASYSLRAFKEATGSLEGHKELYPLKMHIKMRRLESYLLSDTTRLEFLLKAQARRTKSSIHKRAAKAGLR